MILNIGCGGTLPAHKNITFGDVKLDFQLSSNIDVLADADNYLPFKDKVFETVYASHILEHLKRPYDFILECRRICFYELIIAIPYLQGYTENHTYSWDTDSFNHFLNLFPFSNISVMVTGKRFPQPKRLSSIFRLIEYTLKPPCELIARCTI